MLGGVILESACGLSRNIKEKLAINLKCDKEF